MIKRLFGRTIVFAILTLLAFFFMEPLTQLTGWPEVMRGLTAAAIIAWAEVSIMWIRICMEPRVDVQASVEDVHEAYEPRAVAILHLAHTVRWAVRLTAFLVLYLHGM